MDPTVFYPTQGLCTTLPDPKSHKSYHRWLAVSIGDRGRPTRFSPYGYPCGDWVRQSIGSLATSVALGRLTLSTLSACTQFFVTPVQFRVGSSLFATCYALGSSHLTGCYCSDCQGHQPQQDHLTCVQDSTAWDIGTAP